MLYYHQVSSLWIDSPRRLALGDSSLYVQCIILTTRPLFLSLIHSTVEKSGVYPRRGEVRVLAEPVKALLDTCYNSALVSLDVLVALQRQNLLGIPLLNIIVAS